jgi:hypothetical protein
MTPLPHSLPADVGVLTLPCPFFADATNIQLAGEEMNSLWRTQAAMEMKIAEEPMAYCGRLSWALSD